MGLNHHHHLPSLPVRVVPLDALTNAAAAIIAGLIVCIRRKRRSNRRRRWLAGMQQPHLEPQPVAFLGLGNPFQDPVYENEPKSEPLGQSHSAPQDDTLRPQWNRGSPDHLLSDNETTRRYSAFPEGPYTLYPDPYPLSLPNSGTTNPTEFSGRRNIGQTYPTDAPDRSRFRHSYTPSTPSVYPATLAAEEDVHFPADVEPSKPMQRQSAIAAPPRPPRSHLRESGKYASYVPPTPPTTASGSSHSHETDSNPPSPISEHRPQDVFTRRTLLDVRTFTYLLPSNPFLTLGADG